MGFRRRAAILLIGLAAGLLAVWVKAFQLQVVESSAWRAKSRRARCQDRAVEPSRGRILDADGVALAYDRTVLRLAFNPEEWTTRSRWRCKACGTIHFRRTPPWTKPDPSGEPRPATPPPSCSCGTKSPAFDEMAENDLSPLEDALGVPRGALFALAAAEMSDASLRVAASLIDAAKNLAPGTLVDRAQRSGARLSDVVAAEWEAVEEMDAFRRDDLKALFKEDWYRRDALVSEIEIGAPRPLPLKRIEDAAVRLLELDAAGRYRGFHAVPARERWYPRHGLGAQVIGLSSPASAAEAKASPLDEDGAPEVSTATRIGRSGLEAQYDPALRGRRGLSKLERDEDGLFTVRTVEKPAVAGGDVRLYATVGALAAAASALDSALPLGHYALDGPGSGALVVMDAETGAILALADAPTFDLDGDPRYVTKWIEADDADDAAARAREAIGLPPPDLESTPDVSLSRAARIAVEPGSSAKLVTAITMLEGGDDLSAMYHCIGKRATGVYDRPRCSHDHPDVSLEGALEVSCNRYFAFHASLHERIDAHRKTFPDWARQLGLGAPTGIDLLRSARGSYPSDPAASQLRMLAIGQSMTATPLQMARIACLLANGHRLPVPRLAASVGGIPVALGGPEILLKADTLSRIRRGMRGVVIGEHGTARGRFDGIRGLEGVTVYGKTGTAQVGKAFDKDVEDASEPHHLWFVGYAEKAGVEQKIAFAIVLHARVGGSGGDDAAPPVAKFLAWWFGGGRS